MLTDPDTHRAKKERASGPADFPHRGKFWFIRLKHSTLFWSGSLNQFSTSNETTYGNNVYETTYSQKLKYIKQVYYYSTTNSDLFRPTLVKLNEAIMLDLLYQPSAKHWNCAPTSKWGERVMGKKLKTTKAETDN